MDSLSNPRISFAMSTYVLISILACVVTSLLWNRKWRVNKVKHPPGPPALPVLGHLHLIGELPHQSFLRLSRLHGPLMRLRLGAVSVVVVSSPDAAREVFQTQATAFLSRPRLSAVKYALFDSVGLSFAPFGAHWRLARQICVTHLFNNRSLEAMRAVIADEMAMLVRAVYEDSKLENEVAVLPRVKCAANNIMSRMVFGKRFSELISREQKSDNFGDLVQEVGYLLGVFNIGDFIPCLQWLDLQGFVRRMKTVGAKLNAVSQEILDIRRNERRTSPRPPNDVLDVLLSLTEESQKDVVLTDDSVKGIVVDLIAAGTDTTTVTVEWGLAEVLKNPDIMKKLRQELDDTVGTERLVQEADIPRLIYLQAVVKETMRLHPALTLAVRESTQSSQILGYDIPAKTPVFINIWAIGRDPAAWEEPLEFPPRKIFALQHGRTRPAFSTRAIWVGEEGVPRHGAWPEECASYVGELAACF